jgi:uncharacterized protein YndB with AHSA1/START domain
MAAPGSKPAPEAATVTTPSDREIVTSRDFDAPRALVWRALTEPEMLARWWGRGHKLDIERLEVRRGGHWRFVEHTDEGTHGFEGRYREVTPPTRLAMTFDWDGMPGHVSVTTIDLEDLGGGRTRVVTRALFHTPEERDGMLEAGMVDGMNESYAALDRVLADPA